MDVLTRHGAVAIPDAAARNLHTSARPRALRLPLPGYKSDVERPRVILMVAPSIARLISIHAVAHTQDGSRNSRAIVAASDEPRSIRKRTRMS